MASTREMKKRDRKKKEKKMGPDVLGPIRFRGGSSTAGCNPLSGGEKPPKSERWKVCPWGEVFPRKGEPAGWERPSKNRYDTKKKNLHLNEGGPGVTN